MNLILLGPPGSGKGTQSHLLHARLKVPSISTGDIFRAACRKKTPLGRSAERYISGGQLVPDDIVIGIIRQRLSQKDCTQGYILDGFPRTIAQAEALTRILQEKGKKLDAVVNFDVAHEELVKRTSGRRLCRQCETSYHIDFAPPKQAGICDRCGGELYQRDDDHTETVQKRLKVYKDQTSPLIAYYQKEGVLKNVSGLGDSKGVYRQVTQQLGID